MTDPCGMITRLVAAANYRTRPDPPMDRLLVDAALEIGRLLTERDAAQGEVERLRAGGCARDQRTTQYCAEAMALVEERDAAWESGADTMRREIIRCISESLNNCDSRYDGGRIAAYESAIDSASTDPIPPQVQKP